MFSLHDFVMKTILGMVGKENDYRVREFALGWYANKTILTDEDMLTIETAIEESHKVEEIPVIEDIIEEPIIEEMVEETPTEVTENEIIEEEA